MDNLARNVEDARASGIATVFDGNARHAEAVFDDVEAKNGKTKAQQIANDILARELLKRYTGTDPGSPVPPRMTLTPSDVPAYLAALGQREAANAVLDGLTYVVADVPPAE